MNISNTVLIKLSLLLGQYECVRSKKFTENDTLDPSFVLYVQQPSGLDIDAARVLASNLGAERNEAVSLQIPIPKLLADDDDPYPFPHANPFFSKSPSFDHKKIDTSAYDIFWFRSTDEGAVFKSLMPEFVPESDPEAVADNGTDPKSVCTRAIFSILSTLQSKTQYLCDTLGLLHNVTTDLSKSRNQTLSQIVAAHSVRNLRELPLILKLGKVHYLLQLHVQAELGTRIGFVYDTLTVAQKAALAGGSHNLDIVRACEEQKKQCQAVYDTFSKIKDYENKLFSSLNQITDYEPVAKAEGQILLNIINLRKQCDLVTYQSTICRLPDAEKWPPELRHHAVRCGEAVQSLVNITSQVGVWQKPQIQGGGGPASICTTLRSLTWLGASSSFAEVGEKIQSLALDDAWSGAGILFLMRENGAWSCLHMTEHDKRTLGKRWIGGKRDTADQNWLQTAFRETNEETYFLALGPGAESQTQIPNLVLEMGLRHPNRVFVAQSQNKAKYGDKPPYYVLVVNCTPSLETILRQFVSKYVLPSNAADIHKEQGSFVIVPISKLHSDLGQVIKPILGRISKYETLKPRPKQAEKVFLNLVKKYKSTGLGNIPTLLGGMSLSSVVPLLLDPVVPLGVVDSVSEFGGAEAGIGYISADGQRHVEEPGPDPSVWFRQLVPNDVYFAV